MSKNLGNILLVDDDQVFCRVFGEELTRMGFSVTNGYGINVIDHISRSPVDIIILDIVMPEVNGLDLLRSIKRTYPTLDVIMLTGKATIENVITAMKEGAYDYFTKPVELDRIEQVLKRCLEKRKLELQNTILKKKLSEFHADHPIGNSNAMHELKSLINRFAESDSTVLIQGESGVGKEVIANMVHKNSFRREGPFIVVDCTALKESLLESELFGHEKGAFTGAVRTKHGLFEVAESGTLFLDEVSELSASLQSKLLRVVETKSFRRLGGTERILVDVRLIAATNKDLLELVQKGNFREDLYYRLNVIALSIPPLRERKKDIPLLVDHFLAQCNNSGNDGKKIATEALEMLIEYNWPGNVRELKNVIERASLLSEGPVIGVADIPIKSSPLLTKLRRRSGHDYPSLRQLEKEYMKLILEHTKGNKKLAADILKVDRKTLLRNLSSKSSEE